MINFAVINLKVIIKNVIKIIILFFLIIGIMNLGDIIKKEVKNFSYVDVIKKNISVNYSKTANNDYLKRMIISEFPVLAIKSKEISEIVPNNNIDENSVETSPDSEANVAKIDEQAGLNNQAINVNTGDLRNLPTSVVSENNISENFNVTYGSVKIKNESKYTLTPEILTPNIDYANKRDIIIFHTHTCESYTQTNLNTYTPSGNFRTVDLNYSVAQVGNVLTDILKNKGYNVNHSLAYHDYPAYNGSYNRSYNTVKSMLNEMLGTQMVIDLHRDAIGSKSDYGPCVQIGNEKVAQIMFVIGTDGGGLEHKNWKNNLKFAVKIQEKANEMYPRTI